MKKISRAALLLFFPLFAISQSKGIQFQQNITWQQALELARQENKLVFVDCYASWCGPCKLMDKNVYADEQVGNYFNEHFVSVKYQMDTAQNDDENTKAHYADARALMRSYRVDAYPTFLFISPDGKMIHRMVGYHSTERFIALGKAAIDPAKQYSNLADLYRTHRLPDSSFIYLASIAQAQGDTGLAFEVATEYIEKLFQKSEDSIYKPLNLQFIIAATRRSTDPGFNFLYNNSRKIGNMLKAPMAARDRVDYIISKEETDPFIIVASNQKANDLDWKRISGVISKKYSKAYADRNIINAKIRWYQWKQNWPQFTKSTAMLLKNYGKELDDTQINFSCWDVFEHSDQKNELQIARVAMRGVVVRHPDSAPMLDTYANILYKLGNIKESLPIEQKAVELSLNDKVFVETYEKMKAGKKTW